MLKGKEKSSKSKSKQERTYSKLTVSPDDERDVKLNLEELYRQYIHRGNTKSRNLADMTALGISTSLPFGHSIIQDDGNDSIWLFEVLDNIGVNSCYRKICQEGAILHEIIGTFTSNTVLWSVGSAHEGTSVAGLESDVDSIQCEARFPVIEDLSKADITRMSFLIVREPETSAGYVKLQLVWFGVPCMKKNWPLICAQHPSIKPYFTTDRFDRIVLCDILFETVDTCPLFSRAKNKPAAKMENVCECNIDAVQCYQCQTWPSDANEWLTRHRCNGWPTQKTIDELKSLGFFVVRKGHPFSPEIDLEWRISLSLQERKLLFNLSDVQYKCYVVLKMLNRDFLHLDCITTYHWKTCLFYMIEENEPIIWEKKLLFYCVDLCIKRMLKWVRIGCCPNYFIPGENMFEGRMNDSLKVVSENKLVELLNVGFAILLRVQSYNICDYVTARKSLERCQKLQAESIKVFTKQVYMLKAGLYNSAMHGVSMLFEKYNRIGKQTNVIEILWQTLNYIQHVHDEETEHTQQEKRRALSILLPIVYTCLASNISAICIQRLNHQVRDFLLYGCYIYFMKGDLAGRLKNISVLYALGCYKECEWYLDQLDEGYITYNPSVCVCKYTNSVMDPTDTGFIEISKLKMSTCVFFLPTELPIIPTALKFELFKYFGISSHERAKVDFRWHWDRGAVVDSNIFYFFLKYLVNRKVKEDKFSKDALYDINKIGEVLFGSNVRHRDVAYNLMAWCYFSVGWTREALGLLRQSWYIKHPLGSLVFLLKKEKKQEHYLLNSAKLHLLVILFNIWFSRNQPMFNFCFQCFVFCREAHQNCNNCKTATYCSEQCKQINWTIHEAVCKLVCSYHDV